MIKEDVKNAIKTTYELSGISIRKLAKQFGLDRKTVKNIINGDEKNKQKQAA